MRFTTTFGAGLMAILTIPGVANAYMSCAVDKVNPGRARVDFQEEPDGTVRANLIFGSSGSGVVYTLVQTSPGLYEGGIKTQPQFKMKLFISQVSNDNNYIIGVNAKLLAIYPDASSKTGSSIVNVGEAEKFVCGSQAVVFTEQ